MMKTIALIVLIILNAELSFTQDTKLLFTNSGTITFRSESQQELINSTSEDMRGLIDLIHKTFAFKVAIRTFKGFNSALQQEQFNEKFLESDKYPEASFIGKIIEDLDFKTDGNYEIRAKGKLWIHGKEEERIIKSKIQINKGKLIIESHFSILLSDFNIKVPKVVHEKVASEINVEIKAVMQRKSDN